MFNLDRPWGYNKRQIVFKALKAQQTRGLHNSSGRQSLANFLKIFENKVQYF